MVAPQDQKQNEQFKRDNKKTRFALKSYTGQGILESNDCQDSEGA